MKIIHEWFYRNSYRHVIIINVLSVFVHFGDMLHSKFLCCLFNDNLLCLGNLSFHTYDDYLIYLALTVSLSILPNRFDFAASGFNIVVLTMHTRFCNYLKLHRTVAFIVSCVGRYSNNNYLTFGGYWCEFWPLSVLSHKHGSNAQRRRNSHFTRKETTRKAKINI